MTKSEKRDIVEVVHYMYQRVGAKISAQILVCLRPSILSWIRQDRRGFGKLERKRAVLTSTMLESKARIADLGVTTNRDMARKRCTGPWGNKKYRQAFSLHVILRSGGATHPRTYIRGDGPLPLKAIGLLPHTRNLPPSTQPWCSSRGGGGYSLEFLVGVCRPHLQI